MDLMIRFWDEQQNQIQTRYYTSQFLGHATSEDMVDHFSKSVLESGLKISNLVQVSINGPNVIWKFYEIIKQKLDQEYDTGIKIICGLHNVHDFLKAEAEATD